MNRLFEETFACPPRRSSSGNFKPPRRMKSRADSGIIIDMDPLDNIGEVEEFVPTKPRRCKSSDELDAALLSWDTEEDALRDHMVSSVCSDLEDMELDHMMEELSLSGDAQHRRPTNIMNTDSFCSNCSFYSIGSSMTLAQEMQPGRFITPMNSFNMGMPLAVAAAGQEGVTNNEAPSCGAVKQQGKAIVDPMKFITADTSFRLPLVRADSLKPKDEPFILKIDKTCQSPVVEKQPQKRTFQLNMGAMPLPPLATPFDNDNGSNPADEIPPSPTETAEEPPKSPPPKFGLKRKSSIYRGP